VKEVRIIALGTILAASFALGVQAQSQTTGAVGDASSYETGQPDSTSQQGDVARTDPPAVTEPEKQTATEPEKQTSPALPTEVETLDQNWNPPAHL
jgi:hypothetical protein